jgi:hypothetical protein
MENKQTAVDLMFQRAISVLPMGSIDARRRLEETYQQAKATEKEQIVTAHIEGQPLYSCQSEKAKQYYNETYEK